MKNAYKVEECTTITPKQVLRILKGYSESGIDAKKANVGCWLDNPNEPDLISASISGHDPQTLCLEWIDMTFGPVAFFKCNCGLRASKLYLPPGTAEFRCRQCYRLKYELSNLNRKSAAGLPIYRFDRMVKLADERNSISRIFYDGKFTRRFSQYLARCRKYGFKELAESAEGLLEIVKSQ